MTSCNHHPVFKVKTFFARNPSYICKECGAEIEMTANTKMFSRVANGLTIAALAYVVLTGNISKSDSHATLIYFAETGGIVVAFLLLQLLIFKFGKYKEVEPSEKPETSSTYSENLYGSSTKELDETAVSSDTSATSDTSEFSDPSDTSGTYGTSETEDNTSTGNGLGSTSVPGNSKYTKEQLELMALYESYAKLERDENDTASAPTAYDQAPVEEEEDTCTHFPAKNWKNYIPGNYDFKCVHCGKAITFTLERKKRLNLILMVISLGVLMASFSTSTIPFWALAAMVPVILLVGGLIQYFFITHSTFILKDTNVK